MQPGEVYGVKVEVWSMSYIFNAGHALRVSISSSNYPRFSANPNNGQNLNSTAPPVIAQNTVSLYIIIDTNRLNFTEVRYMLDLTIPQIFNYP